MSGMPRSRVTLALVALIVLVIVMWLVTVEGCETPGPLADSNSATLRAMQTASGNKSGHIVALIAVGLMCCF